MGKVRHRTPVSGSAVGGVLRTAVPGVVPETARGDGQLLFLAPKDSCRVATRVSSGGHAVVQTGAPALVRPSPKISRSNDTISTKEGLCGPGERKGPVRKRLQKSKHG